MEFGQKFYLKMKFWLLVRTEATVTTDRIDIVRLQINPGAEEVNRTPDLLITNQLLYHLSYFGNS